MLWLLIFNGVMSFFTGLAGRSRKIGFWPVFVISLLMTPFLGILAVVLSGRKYSIKTMVENQELQIRQLNSMSTIMNAPAQAKTTTSVADELLKLNELLEKGVLTSNEYEQQKKRILGNQRF